MDDQTLEVGPRLTPKEISAKDVIRQQVEWWGRGTLATGEPALQNGQEMLGRYPFISTFKGNLRFFHPSGNHYQPIIDGFAQLNEKVKKITVTPNRSVNILMVPESRFCPRGGGAAPSGDMILVDVSPTERDLYGVWAHERVHSIFSQSYGICSLPDLIEGAAMYFSRKVSPADPRNDYEALASQLKVYEKLAAERGPMGVSHTALLGQLQIKDEEKLVPYEYSYVFGAFLAKHIVETYGQDKYLEFYQKTCHVNLFDNATGQQLIENHELCPGVKNRDVIRQALRSVGLDSALIDQEFSRELQGLAREKGDNIARGKRGNIFQRIGDFLQRMEGIE